MSTMQLAIEGMTCGHCAQSVSKELTGLTGVSDVSVDQPNGIALLTASEPIAESALAGAIERAGYRMVSVKLVS